MEAVIIVGMLLAAGFYIMQKMPAPAPAPAPTPAPPTPESTAETILDLGANYIESGGTKSGATFTGAEIGTMTIEGGATAVEAGTAGALAAALLGAGPIGAAVAGAISVFAQQGELMAHIDRRNVIWPWITPKEYSIWKGKKDKADDNWWDPTAHRSVREYEEALINYYTSAEGAEAFKERAEWFVQSNQRYEIRDAGIAWLADRGITYSPLTAEEREARMAEAYAFQRYGSLILRAFRDLGVSYAEQETLTDEQKQAYFAQWVSGLTEAQRTMYGLAA